MDEVFLAIGFFTAFFATALGLISFVFFTGFFAVIFFVAGFVTVLDSPLAIFFETLVSPKVAETIARRVEQTPGAMVAMSSHGHGRSAAAATVACCQLTTSLVNDVLRGSDVSGDERFFSAEGAPPNIHFIVDASRSMQELPQVKQAKALVF